MVFDSNKPGYTLPGAHYKWWPCVYREDWGIWGRPWDHLRGPTGRGERHGSIGGGVSLPGGGAGSGGYDKYVRLSQGKSGGEESPRLA